MQQMLFEMVLTCMQLFACMSSQDRVYLCAPSHQGPFVVHNQLCGDQQKQSYKTMIARLDDISCMQFVLCGPQQPGSLSEPGAASGYRGSC